MAEEYKLLSNNELVDIITYKEGGIPYITSLDTNIYFIRNQLYHILSEKGSAFSGPTKIKQIAPFVNKFAKDYSGKMAPLNQIQREYNIEKLLEDIIPDKEKRKNKAKLIKDDIKNYIEISKREGEEIFTLYRKAKLNKACEQMLKKAGKNTHVFEYATELKRTLKYFLHSKLNKESDEIYTKDEYLQKVYNKIDEKIYKNKEEIKKIEEESIKIINNLSKEQIKKFFENTHPLNIEKGVVYKNSLDRLLVSYNKIFREISNKNKEIIEKVIKKGYTTKEEDRKIQYTEKIHFSLLDHSSLIAFYKATKKIINFNENLEFLQSQFLESFLKNYDENETDIFKVRGGQTRKEYGICYNKGYTLMNTEEATYEELIKGSTLETEIKKELIEAMESLTQNLDEETKKNLTELKDENNIYLRECNRRSKGQIPNIIQLMLNNLRFIVKKKYDKIENKEVSAQGLKNYIIESVRMANPKQKRKYLQGLEEILREDSNPSIKEDHLRMIKIFKNHRSAKSLANLTKISIPEIYKIRLEDADINDENTKKLIKNVKEKTDDKEILKYVNEFENRIEREELEKMVEDDEKDELKKEMEEILKGLDKFDKKDYSDKKIIRIYNPKNPRDNEIISGLTKILEEKNIKYEKGVDEEQVIAGEFLIQKAVADSEGKITNRKPPRNLTDTVEIRKNDYSKVIKYLTEEEKVIKVSGDFEIKDLEDFLINDKGIDFFDTFTDENKIIVDNDYIIKKVDEKEDFNIKNKDFEKLFEHIMSKIEFTEHEEYGSLLEGLDNLNNLDSEKQKNRKTEVVKKIPKKESSLFDKKESNNYIEQLGNNTIEYSMALIDSKSKKESEKILSNVEEKFNKKEIKEILSESLKKINKKNTNISKGTYLIQKGLDENIEMPSSKDIEYFTKKMNKDYEEKKPEKTQKKPVKKEKETPTISEKPKRKTPLSKIVEKHGKKKKSDPRLIHPKIKEYNNRKKELEENIKNEYEIIEKYYKKERINKELVEKMQPFIRIAEGDTDNIKGEELLPSRISEEVNNSLNKILSEIDDNEEIKTELELRGLYSYFAKEEIKSKMEEKIKELHKGSFNLKKLKELINKINKKRKDFNLTKFIKYYYEEPYELRKIINLFTENVKERKKVINTVQNELLIN